MPSTLENSKFKQFNSTLFITLFYTVSLMITSAVKGKSEGKKTIISNNEMVIELKDMLKS